MSVLIDGVVIEQPFFGGTNQPRIQWLDWDDDGDTDLFLQDEDNHLRYYENLGDSFSYDFYLITTNFQNLNLGNWFLLQDFDGDGDSDLMTQNENIAQGSYRAIKYYQNQNSILSLSAESIMTE